MAQDTLLDGDRVYSFDLDGSRAYGTLQANQDEPRDYDWYIKYDDGEDFVVLDMEQVFKA